MVTNRFAAPTEVPAEAELFDGFGSAVSLETFAWLVMEAPLGVAALTRTVIVNVLDAVVTRLGAVQTTSPIRPTSGVAQVHPEGADRDWNVVLMGTASVSATVLANDGPWFVTARV